MPPFSVLMIVACDPTAKHSKLEAQEMSARSAAVGVRCAAHRGCPWEGAAVATGRAAETMTSALIRAVTRRFMMCSSALHLPGLGA